MTYTSGNIQQLIDQRDHFYQALLFVQKRLLETDGLDLADVENIDQALMAIDLALMELPNEKDSCSNCDTCSCN